MKHRAILVISGFLLTAMSVFVLALLSHTAWPMNESGRRQEAAHALPGPPDSPVENHIPNINPPTQQPRSFSKDPALGISLSRTRLMVIFRQGATVGDANRLISEVNGQVVGGDERLRLIVVDIPESADLEKIKGTARLLREHQNVKGVSIDKELGPN